MNKLLQTKKELRDQNHFPDVYIGFHIFECRINLSFKWIISHNVSNIQNYAYCASLKVLY